MGPPKLTHFKDSDIISASEIGQYHYCSVAWYLQKCGYEPKSHLLDVGTKKHKELGIVLDHVNTNIKRSKVFAYLGYLLLIIGILIFISEVIL